MTYGSRIIAAALLIATPCGAQVTSIATNNPAPKGHDLNKVVCEVDQTTGTRLGVRKVCKTVLEWEQMRTEHRETVESYQQRNSGVGCQEGMACSPH